MSNQTNGGELRQLLSDFLGPSHYHRCVTCSGRGCLNCRNTGMNQTPCPLCDADGIAFKRRNELIAAIQTEITKATVKVQLLKSYTSLKEVIL